MKRFIILFILTITLLTLCSCGEPPAIESDFSAAFSVRDNEIDYAGTLTKVGNDMTVSMSEPYPVKGLVFDYADGKLQIRCGAHTVCADAGYLPEGAVPAALYHSLLYLSQARYTGSESGTDRYLLPTPDGDAALTTRDGVPQTLTLPQGGMDFCFDSVEE